MVHGEIFWYAVGRFYAWPNKTVQDVGYFPRIGQIDRMFAGAPGADTAHFTFHAEPFTPVPLPITSATPTTLTASMDPPGSFTIYFHASPGGVSFDEPGSFASDEPIAVFTRMGNVVGASTPSGASNFFSATLGNSTAFALAGAVLNLKSMLGGIGITQMGSAGPAVSAIVEGKSASVADFVGSAFAI
jgi:hypothetical protein